MQIDILIPTYARPAALQENLEHILARMRDEGVEEHYRVVVSDNASPQATQGVVRALMQRVNGRRELVAYHRNEQNIGLEANVVQAATLATADFVLWCGDDDFFSHGYLRFLVECISTRRALGCVIPGLAALHGDGTIGPGRDDSVGEQHFPAGYRAAHSLSHLAHQMSGLLFRREGLLEAYLARSGLRNPYLFIYFAANRLLRFESIYAPRYRTLVNVSNAKAWGYNSIGLLDEVFKNYLALRPTCTEREIDDLMLRFVLMHSYRLAFRPLRPLVLGRQLLDVWKAGGGSMYFRRKMGMLFLREAAAGALG